MTEQTHPYVLPVQTKPRKASDAQRRRNNNSLPSINFPVKEQKVNAIRHEIDQTRNQIITLQARINALKYQKQKHEKTRQRNMSEISFIHTVRDRMYEDKKAKQNFQDKREKELEELRKQTMGMRDQMLRQREVARSLLSQRKEEEAEMERQRRRQDEEQVRKVRSIEMAENQLKAMTIKKNQLEIEEKLKLLNQSRISFARNNHHERVEKSLSEKQRMQRVLSNLKKQQERMLQDCKKSEADMLSSLYQLQTLNPERRRRAPASSRVFFSKED